MKYTYLSTCLCFVFGVCGLWACSSEEDKLAKQRIFSPEDPPQVVSAAKEVLAAGALSSQPAHAERVLHMGIAETTERLGAHRFEASLRMEWEGNRRKQVLTEERLLLSGAGGVSGDFSASLRNGRGQGYDILRIGHQVFAKSQHSNYRQRQRDRGMAERMRQEAFGVLAEIDTLFQHRLGLKADGKEAIAGKEAHKYLVQLSEEPRQTQAARPLPAKLERQEGRVEGEPGQVRPVEEGTRLRLAFVEQRVPELLKGALWIDAASAVVLKAEIEGALRIEGEASGRLHIRLSSKTDEIGKSPGLSIPENYTPDEDKPQGVAAALERFGFGRKSRTEADIPELVLDEE